MSSSLPVEIDPDAVGTLAQTLGLIAQRADELVVEVTVATTRAHLATTAPANLAEIDEELGLLATILTERALLASGFRVHLGDDARAREIELWESLADSDGALVPIAGDHAVSILLDYAAGGDTDGDGAVTVEELLRLAKDEAAPDVVRSAAAILADDRDLLVRIANQHPLETVWHGTDLVDVDVAHLAQWLEDNETLRSQIGDTDEIDRATQLDAVNRQIFVHDPDAAREFLPMLDNAAHDGDGLPLFAVDVSAVEHLFSTAMIGVADDDLTTRFAVISQLPETEDATRGRLITRFYAETAQRLDALINPDDAGDLSAPGHAGLTWPAWGASASNTVSKLIDGSFDLGRVDVPGYFPGADEIRQMGADANQAIFTDVLADYVRFLETFGASGADPSDPVLITEFLNSFGEGERDLRNGFAHQLRVMLIDDHTARDEHQLRANVIISVHEQAVADSHLSLERAVDAGLGAFPMTQNQLLNEIFNGPAEAVAEEIFTGIGTYDIPLANGEEWSIPLDEPTPPNTHPGNLALDLDFTDEDNPDALRIEDVDLGPDVDTSALPPLTGTAETFGVSIDVDDWNTDHTSIDGRWQDFPARMPVIVNLMQQQHSNQDVFDATQLILDSP